MKIGIITYHCSNNYGAQLQAYATCHFLQKMGHEAEVIDCNTIGVGPIFMWSLESLRAIFLVLSQRENAIACSMSSHAT